VVAAIERVTAIAATVKDLGVALKDVLAALKVVQKDAHREGSKRARRAAPTDASGEEIPRKPSGFAKPAQLSPELCQFLGVPDSTLMARTEVTRLITKYVKDNELYGKDDKRTINPDGKLIKLLAVKEDEKITYFNLQSHIKHHFVKTAAAADEAAAAAAPASVEVA
jgi:upstream activation factor subunit UAF30